MLSKNPPPNKQTAQENPNMSQNLEKQLESVFAGFHQVLREHGIEDLTISSFRLTPTERVESFAAANTGGCWKQVCYADASGHHCTKVWDPNCT
jgi:hypothetical protein